MENKSAKKKLCAGKYYELTEDVNAIPKGIYFLEWLDDFTLTFTVGKKAFFTVIGNVGDLLKPVPESSALITKTTQSDFLDRYYKLLYDLKDQDPSMLSTSIYTMCFIDPSIDRNFRELH